MLKVTIGDPGRGLAARPRNRGRAEIPSRRVKSEDGRTSTVYTVDVHSKTVDDDLLTVFKRGVARARREARRNVKKPVIAAE